jgi:PAS domain S-box-containing protein
MSGDAFNQQLEAAFRHVDDLMRRADQASPPPGILAEALEELGATLQELGVMGEELRQQNEALAAAEQAAEVERQRYQDLFNFAPDGYVVTNSDGVIQAANQAAVQLLGVQQEYLVGKPLVLFIAEQDRKAFRTRLLQPPAEHHIGDWTLHMQPRHGAPCTAAVTVTTIRDSQGRIIELRWLLRDITEHQQMEDALVESEERYRSVIAALAEGVILHDADGAIRTWNASAERLLGLSAEEIAGRTPMDLKWRTIHEDGSPFPSEAFPSMVSLRTGMSCANVVMGVYKPNGELRWLTSTSRPLFHNRESTPYAAVVSFIDITERRRMEEQLRERERLAAIGTTAATFAHEVGNPLNSIFTTLQLLERRLVKHTGPPDDKIMTPMRRITDEIKRLSMLLDEFRSLTRRQILDLQPTQVATLAREVLAGEALAYAARGIEVEQAFPPDLPQISADGEKLKQVLLNLCKNAVEAMPQGGTLTLRAHHTGGQISLEISDTGVGVPTGVDIFEPFVTTKAQGTGLGLTIVRQIVAAHGGALTYQSTPGQRTTFTLTLPISPHTV